MTDEEMRSIAERVDDLCGTPAVRRRWVKRAEELFRHEATQFRRRYPSVSDRIRSTEHCFVVDLCYAMLLVVRDASLPDDPLTPRPSRAVLPTAAWGADTMQQEDAAFALRVVEQDLQTSGLLSNSITAPFGEGDLSAPPRSPECEPNERQSAGTVEQYRIQSFHAAITGVEELIRRIESHLQTTGGEEPASDDADSEIRAHQDAYHPIYNAMFALEFDIPRLERYMGEEWVSHAMDRVRLCWRSQLEPASIRLPKAVRQLRGVAADLRGFRVEDLDSLVFTLQALLSELGSLDPNAPVRLKKVGVTDCSSLFENEMAHLWSQADDIRGRHHKLPSLPPRPARPVDGIVPLREWCRTCIHFRQQELRGTKPKRRRRRRPLVLPDRPLTPLETHTVEVVSKQCQNFAAAAKELQRDAKTVRENYARAMRKMDRMLGKKSRSVAAQRLPTDRRGQVGSEDRRRSGG